MHAAGIVPGLAEFAAAANVGDSDDDAEMRTALFAFDEDQVGAEGGYAGEHDAGTVGNDFVPAGANGIAGGGGHQAEGAAGVVGANEEGAAGGIAGTAGMMIDVVFVIVMPFVD